MIDRPETASVQRDLGHAEGRLDAVERDLLDIKRELKDISKTLQQATGGWKTLLLIAGTAGAIGAFVGKFLPFLVSK